MSAASVVSCYHRRQRDHAERAPLVEGEDAEQAPPRLLAADLELKRQALLVPGDDEPAFSGTNQRETTPGLDHDVNLRTHGQLDGQRAPGDEAADERDQQRGFPVQGDLLGKLGHERSSPGLFWGAGHQVEGDRLKSVVDAQDAAFVENDAWVGNSVDILVAVYQRRGRQSCPIEGLDRRRRFRDATEAVSRVERWEQVIKLGRTAAPDDDVGRSQALDQGKAAGRRP